MTTLHAAMCKAIGECEGIFVDLERITDPAEKLAAYVRIAQNHEPERQASEVRLRAERELSRCLKQAVFGVAGEPKRSRARAAKP